MSKECFLGYVILYLIATYGLAKLMHEGGYEIFKPKAFILFIIWAPITMPIFILYAASLITLELITGGFNGK